jgi:hypothetical protein
MPITRRRRAQPPEEPDYQQNNTAEAAEQSQPAEVSLSPAADTSAAAPDEPAADASDEPVLFATPEQPLSSSPEPVSQEAVTPPVSPPTAPAPTTPSPASSASAYLPIVSAPPVSNGSDHQSYTPAIEGGRRTARGEFFRRPPQVPPITATPAPTPQAPTHEITLPLGNLLHLAYNPGYTGAEEARSKLLSQLAHESKTGGRARCWNCGSLAIVYDRWSTRSKTFGEVGIAYCEICGVWSVL